MYSVLIIGPALKGSPKPFLPISEIQISFPPYPPGRLLTKYKNFSYSVDGCSAPTPFLSLLDIAKLYQKLGSKQYKELSIAYNAMSQNSYFIGGKNRFDTDFTSIMGGRGVCKAGGEAVRGLVIHTKKYGTMGIAIKIIDGNQRAIEVATMAVLNHLNILHIKEKEKLTHYESKQLVNCNKLNIGKVVSCIIK